ncbi:MAG: (2Fe-2S)-binding protein [Chloroflexi bacterium]|nr:(2Fe-2S)-binding protein [Chloroflexota bacterium]
MKLKINNTEYEIRNPTRTLLSVLRDELNLLGAKEGCGIGVCGACTVLIDDKPQSSCLMLAVQCAEKEIVTIEGLAREGVLHRVQQAFYDHAAFQCAYCTPGFILATVALLNENSAPSDDDIREYLSGNLCRCGSYVNILRAVRAASDA